MQNRIWPGKKQAPLLLERLRDEGHYTHHRKKKKTLECMAMARKTIESRVKPRPGSLDEQNKIQDHQHLPA
jgi:hypothetical protein